MMEKNNQILVPIDFSSQSKIALEQASSFAMGINADIILINVIDQSIFEHITHLFKSDADCEGELVDKATVALESIAAEYRKKGLNISTVVKCGKIYEQITKISDESGADFIVMGTTGASEFKKKFLGSNAMRVIRESSVPVISIKGSSHRLGVQNIILPLDLSKETRDKVGRAVELAQIFDSTIKVLSVQTSDDEFLVKRLQRQLHQVEKYLKEHKVRFTVDTVDGDDIAEEVIKFSKKENGDLVMVMTQQETNWTEYFIGSSAQEIINSSEVPVLSIRPIFRKDHTEFVVQ